MKNKVMKVLAEEKGYDFNSEFFTNDIKVMIDKIEDSAKACEFKRILN